MGFVGGLGSDWQEAEIIIGNGNIIFARRIYLRDYEPVGSQPRTRLDFQVYLSLGPVGRVLAEQVVQQFHRDRREWGGYRACSWRTTFLIMHTSLLIV